MKIRILLVNSNESLYFALNSKLPKEKFGVELLTHPSETLSALGREQTAAVILDKKLLGATFQDTVHRIRSQYPQTQIVVLFSENERQQNANGISEIAGSETLDETIDLQELPFAIKYCLKTKNHTGIFIHFNARSQVKPEKPSAPTLTDPIMKEWESQVPSLISESIRNGSEKALYLVENNSTTPSAGEATGLDAEGRTHPEGGFTALKKKWSDEFEKRYLQTILNKNQGNVSAAAREAKVDRSNLLRLMRRHGIKSLEFRKAA